MATPVVATDGVDLVEAAVANKYLAGPGGSKIEVKTHWASIVESGAAFTVDSGVDSGGIETADCAFNGTNTSLEITISGFVNAPSVQVSRLNGGAGYVPYIASRTNVLIDIRFADPTTGADIVTGVIDSNMAVEVFVIGF